jgi:hypothetical protein
MGDFASELQGDLDEIRGIPGELGLRSRSVTLLVRTWTGAQPGFGTLTDTRTVLTNNSYPGQAQNPRIREISNREIIASGGLYRDRDIKIGPLTPSYVADLMRPAGGVTDANVDPPVTVSPTETFWLVAGPTMPAGGAWCEKIEEEYGAFHYFVVVRATGKTP